MKPEDPAERRQTHFRGVRSGHETRGPPDGRGCPDVINLLSKAFLPVLIFIASEQK